MDDLGQTAQYLLAAGQRLQERLTVGELITPDDDEVTSAPLLRAEASEVLEIINAVIRLVQSVPTLIMGTSDVEKALDVEGAFEAWDDAAASVATPIAVADVFADDTDSKLAQLYADRHQATLEDVPGLCSMFALELRQVKDSLRAARQRQDHDAMLLAAQDGRRKAAKVLGMTQSLITDVVAPGSRSALDEQQELAESLEVRDAVLSLQRELLGAIAQGEATTDAHVGVQAAVCHKLLADFLALPTVAKLRPADRHELRRMKRRLSDWLSHTGVVDEVRQILADIAAFAELLSGINQREILQSHDRRARSECLLLLQSLLSMPDIPEELLLAGLREAARSCQVLRWRDREFARLTENWVSVHPTQPGDVVRCAQELAQKLEELSL